MERIYEYRWSSATVHIDRGTDPSLSEDCYLKEEIKDWQVYLSKKDDEQLVKDIRNSLMTGRPCGDDEFIQSIEGLLDRKLPAYTQTTVRETS